MNHNNSIVESFLSGGVGSIPADVLVSGRVKGNPQNLIEEYYICKIRNPTLIQQIVIVLKVLNTNSCRIYRYYRTLNNAKIWCEKVLRDGESRLPYENLN